MIVQESFSHFISKYHLHLSNFWMVDFKGYSNYSWINNSFHKPMIIKSFAIFILLYLYPYLYFTSWLACSNLKKHDENKYEKITTFWKELWTEQDFCDVTLLCEDNQIQIHKVILSSISPGYVINVIIKQQLSIVLKYIHRRSTQKYKIYMWAMWRQSNNKRNSRSLFKHSSW